MTRTAARLQGALLGLLIVGAGFAPAADKKIVLIAGAKSHGPGEHEYDKGVRLLKHCLDTSPNLRGFRTEVVTDGWPKDEKVFDDAATVLLFSDGSDRQEQAHPLLREQRLRTLEKLLQRGVGFVAVHYTLFVPAKKGGEQFLDGLGGFFDYESGPKPRGWYSKIKTCTATVTPASPDHPVNRGLAPFELKEEFYYHMKFRPDDPRLKPILSVAIPDEPKPEVVAWAVERKNGGRGFGYTGGHFHSNWQNENVRRMVLNALVWTARGEVPAGGVPSKLPTEEKKEPAALDHQPADPRLKTVLLDRSPNESYMAIKVDTTGRLFVGGREALFVFEPDERGGYQPKRELYRFPPDSWIAGIEVRGDDLYVLTAPALYRFPGGRIKREGLKPERLLWGLPLDLHVSFHCLAWGPEGDLYLNHGDPLLNYGDFNRPDHWGHWTYYTPNAKVPYTGQGAVLRVRPDGSNLRVVAGGLRGPVGLAFDRYWSLFTNDNDHESRPDQFTPPRLLHVTPHADFAWPRGWDATKNPDRFDLLETMLTTPGRGVPVGLAYYDEPFFPAEYRHNLLEARWDRLTIQRHPIQPRGASFTTRDLPFLVGRGTARPVGVAVGRGGRVFATISYMAANEASPHYASDLVMITRADDSPEHPFVPYDAPTAPTEKLWAELSQPSWERRLAAHTEILRRGGELLTEAARRLAAVKDEDPAILHLPWLASACGTPEVAKLLTNLARHPQVGVRLQAVRALAEFPELKAPPEVFGAALRDADLQVQLAALAAFFSPAGELPFEEIVARASGPDTYLRQTAARLLARRATPARLHELAESADPRHRLAAVLAAGFRLTIPPLHEPPPAVPLWYPAENPFFKVRVLYTDTEVDLRFLNRIGSYTTAEVWNAAPPTPERKELFDLLLKQLDADSAGPAALQAEYFLSLLRDPRAEARIAQARWKRDLDRLAKFPQREVNRAWIVGPFDDGGHDSRATHPPEEGAIDLTAEYPTPRGKRTWQELRGQKGSLVLTKPETSSGRASSYLFFRLESAARQQAELIVDTVAKVQLWHNGRPVGVVERGAFPHRALLDVQPGSNDLLLRLRCESTLPSFALHYRCPGEVTAVLPEKLGLATLAQRLKEAKDTPVGPEFFTVDWPGEARKGNREQGRRLFAALGCAKCHAVTLDQKGGGAPSLAEAGKRFTVPHLVESVLLPSKQVAEPFRATTITTTKGIVLTGLVVNETADALDLLLADGTQKAVAKKEVEERTVTALSPMPAGVVKTPAELRDLLAYLLSDNPLPP